MTLPGFLEMEGLVKHRAVLTAVLGAAACGLSSGPLDLADAAEPEWSIESGVPLQLDAWPRPVEHASGTAHHYTGQGLKTFSFTATEREDGSTVGQMQIFARGLREAHYRVVCIDIVDNAAFIAGVATEVRRSPGASIGDPFVFAVWDWGEGAGAQPDQATRGRNLPGEPIDWICSDLRGYADVQAPYDVERGNVQVMSWEW